MKPYSVFANVSCTNAASSRWGYWGAANLDISTWASGKNILAIIPDGCYLNEAGSSSDENVLGLLHVSYNYTTNSVEYHVNSKFSGRFGCRALILYTE